MATYPIYQVDAFTSDIFGGNPAAVVPMDAWPSDEILQNIAAENNLAETAFFIPDENGFHLRWFTPTTEVDLCGHATLASSWVIFNALHYPKNKIHFSSKSGELIVSKQDKLLTLDFPIWAYKEEQDNEGRIADALGAKPTAIYSGPDWVVTYDDYQTVQDMKPDMVKLGAIKEARGMIATAPGYDQYDFVSRAFFPVIGIEEDPVTGSAHCISAPIWSKKLNKTKLSARQISKRGGDPELELKNDRIFISGEAKLYMKGEIYV